MSYDLTLAQKQAWNLARTLMTPVILFQSGSEYGVLPANELENADVIALYEYDPYSGSYSVH